MNTSRFQLTQLSSRLFFAALLASVPLAFALGVMLYFYGPAEVAVKLAIMLVAWTAVTAVAYAFARRMATPLRQLQQTLDALRRGSLEVQPDASLPPDFQALALAVNSIVDEVHFAHAKSVRLAQLHQALGEVRQECMAATSVLGAYHSACSACVSSGAAFGAWVAKIEAGQLVPVAGDVATLDLVSGLNIRVSELQDYWAVPMSKSQLSPGLPESLRQWVRLALRGRVGDLLALRVTGADDAVILLHLPAGVALESAHIRIFEQIAQSLSQSIAIMNVRLEGEDARARERQSAEKFERLFSALPMPAALFPVRTRRFVQVNEAFCAAYGMSREMLVGHSLQEYGVGLSEKDFREFQGRLFQGPIRGALVQVQYHVDDWRHVLVSAEMIDIDGEPHVFSVHLDVSKRVQAEAELREREEQLRFLIDSTNDGIIVIDAEGRVSAFNAAASRMYGWPLDHIVGQSVELLVAGSQRSSMRALLNSAFDPRTVLSPTRTYCLDGLRRNGEMFPVEFTLSRVGAGKRSLLTVSVRDATRSQAEMQARLEQARQQAAVDARSEFFSRMNHELRTPLNAILGFSLLLQDSGAQRLTPDEQQNLELVMLAGKHMLSLVDDILDLTNIEAGRTEISLQPTALCRAVQEVMALHEKGAAPLDVRLHCDDWEGSPLMVLADPHRLWHVLLYVLTGLMRFCRPGWILDARAERSDTTITVELWCPQLALDDAQRNRFFDPFERFGQERANTPGHGLELTLSKQLMRLQGGSLEALADEREGTKLLLTFLRAADSASSSQGEGDEGNADVRLNAGVKAAVAESALDRAEPRIGGPTSAAAESVSSDTVASEQLHGVVLYIEDVEMNYRLVHKLLAPWKDVRLVPAEDGGKGLEAAQRLLPSVILLDMHLPDMTGLEVLTRLKSNPDTALIPVIALSANVMPDEVAKARQQGVVDYWAKPIDFTQFRQEMRRYLTRH